MSDSTTSINFTFLLMLESLFGVIVAVRSNSLFLDKRVKLKYSIRLDFICVLVSSSLPKLTMVCRFIAVSMLSISKRYVSPAFVTLLLANDRWQLSSLCRSYFARVRSDFFKGFWHHHHFISLHHLQRHRDAIISRTFIQGGHI